MAGRLHIEEAPCIISEHPDTNHQPLGESAHSHARRIPQDIPHAFVRYFVCEPRETKRMSSSVGEN